MKYLILIINMLVGVLAFSQGEGVEAIAGNPQLMKKSSLISRANPGTFDSTFIYAPDTIDLPVFDEFSRSKFQVFNAAYTDPGVTFDKVYHVLDSFNAPLANGIEYTLVPTFKRTVDLGNGSFVDTPFPPTMVKIGDLSSYPVTHVPTEVYPPFYVYDTIDFPNPLDTVWITEPEVYQDSATQFFTTVNDPDLIWWDSYAYHNYTMALDPWSLGVVTFDGLDENGYPYAIGTAQVNYADFLTSKPIDMAAVSAADSVYFSFLFQREGLADPPEGGDSLIVEFYSKDLDQWNRVWSTSGGTVGEFEFVHIPITSNDYFKKGFQFRFRNYGALSGSLDHFHIDYVNLRAFSGAPDTVIHDFAFSYPIYTLLDSYTSVPWDHYKNNFTGKMSSNVQVVVRNSDNGPANEQDGTVEIEYSGTNEGNFVLQESLLNNNDLNYLPGTTYTSFHDFSGGDRFDETKTGLYEEFDVIGWVTPITPSIFDVPQNDSTFGKQIFQNYYSYDDGTAEQAYGPTGGPGTGVTPELAIQYTPYESDSLIGVKMHFVPTVNDVSNNLFLITVWADNNGEPDTTILYQDSYFFPRQPQYEYKQNLFTTYYFQDSIKVPVNGTFYIGWKQLETERLGIGLDKNIVNNDKTFYKTDSELSWNQSAITGSVMIRPIFSTGMDAILSVEDVEEEVINVYPNPTSGVFTVDLNEDTDRIISVYSSYGALIGTYSTNQIDLSNQPTGIYFIQIEGISKPVKLVKQ